MTLTIISIGLSDEKDLSQKAISEAKKCDQLYVELYTMILNTDTQRLTDIIGRPIQELNRSKMEEGSEELILEAKTKNVGILIGGDALIATTHIGLLIEAAKEGIKTRVIHGSSIFTAVAETGLSIYKFGCTVTLPLPIKGPLDSVFATIEKNREHGLHTLILLDLNTETQTAHTIKTAIKILLEANNQNYDPDTLTIGVSRLGWSDQLIKVDTAQNLAQHDFGEPPHVIIVPGRLHFLESEALKALWGCPQETLEDYDYKSSIDSLIWKYSEGTKKVIKELEILVPPREVKISDVKDLIEHARRYLNDAEYYAKEQKHTALASVSYTEGILDALKLLGLVEFQW